MLILSKKKAHSLVFCLFSHLWSLSSNIFLLSRSPMVFQTPFPVGTPPPDDTWCASLSGATPSGLPKERYMVRSPIRTSLGRSTRHSQTSHSDDSISYPDMLFGSLTKVSKSYYVILTAYHSPRSATCRAKGQE